MAHFIPEDKIQEVKNAADIVDIVSDTVVLKKSGKNHLGLCPFHSEKTPSFTVSPDKQIFHCFGCGTGGNVFTFLMKHQGVGFPEAVRSVAKRCGVALPERKMSEAERRRYSEQEELYRVNRMAVEFFHECLTQRKVGKGALQYLTDRGIDDQVIDTFQLGYAPPGWSHLATWLANREIPMNRAMLAGLVAERRSGGGHYDRFRDRVIFPIHDTANRTVGFGGRILEDGEPKYLNSPETPVYNKRRVLYGFNRTKAECRRHQAVFIVEGYLDLLSLYQAGVTNAVATLGTALTPEHLQLLKGQVAGGRITLVFDSDDAGVRAAHRSLDLFWKAHADFRRGDVHKPSNADTRILVLPKGHDPDSFVREFGGEAFQEKASEAPGIIGFMLDSAIERHGRDPQGRIRAASDLLQPLASINDPVARQVYVQQVAERLGIDEVALMTRIRETARQPKGPQPPQPPVSAELAASAGPVDRFEQAIVAMMMHCPDMVQEVRDRSVIERLTDPRMRRIAEFLAEWHLSGHPADPAAIVGALSDNALLPIVTELAMRSEQWSTPNCMKLLDQFELKHQPQRDELIRRIRAAEARQDFDAVARLLKQKALLAEKKQQGTNGGQDVHRNESYPQR